MSSILEALRKLEEDKTREAESPDRPTPEAVVEEELLGRRRRNATVRITPAAFILVSLGFGTAFVAVSVAVSFWIMRTSAATSYVAWKPAPTELVEPRRPAEIPALSMARTPPEPIQSSSDSRPETRAPEQTEAERVPATEKSPATAVSETPPGPEQPLAAETMPAAAARVEPFPVPAPEPSSPSPTIADPPLAPPRPQATTDGSDEVRPALRSQTRPTTSPSAYMLSPAPAVDSERSISPRRAYEPVDPETLPILSEGERERLGLPKLEINIVGEASRTRPRPSALINLNKVYVDDTIPSTNARLIGVSVHGIAIEVAGQRYFLPKR